MALLIRDGFCILLQAWAICALEFEMAFRKWLDLLVPYLQLKVLGGFMLCSHLLTLTKMVKKGQQKTKHFLFLVKLS